MKKHCLAIADVDLVVVRCPNGVSAVFAADEDLGDEADEPITDLSLTSGDLVLVCQDGYTVWTPNALRAAFGSEDPPPVSISEAGDGDVVYV